jgi:hypothetical protein
MVKPVNELQQETNVLCRSIKTATLRRPLRPMTATETTMMAAPVKFRGALGGTTEPDLGSLGRLHVNCID